MLLNFTTNRSKQYFYLSSFPFPSPVINYSLSLVIGLKTILEPFWPNVRSKIDKIQDNINIYKALMTVNVTLEHILRAQWARKLALDEYDRAARFREH